MTFFTGLIGALIYYATSPSRKNVTVETGDPRPSSVSDPKMILLKSVCRNLESGELGRLSLDGAPRMIFNPMKGTKGSHEYPVSSISNVKVEKDGNRMIIELQEGTRYAYDYAGGVAVWGTSGFYPEEWQSKIMEIKNPPKIQAQRSSTSEDPVAILKVRFAKGEITKEQYEEMLKMITSTG